MMLDTTWVIRTPIIMMWWRRLKTLVRCFVRVDRQFHGSYEGKQVKSRKRSSYTGYNSHWINIYLFIYIYGWFFILNTSLNTTATSIMATGNWTDSGVKPSTCYWKTSLWIYDRRGVQEELDGNSQRPHSWAKPGSLCRTGMIRPLVNDAPYCINKICI